MGRERSVLGPAATAIAFLGAACAHNPDVRVTRAQTARAPDSVFINVINDNYYDARIYALYDGGARHALGTIDGNQSRAGLAIPWQPRSLAFEVILVVDGGVYRSEKVNVAGGDLVLVHLPPNIESSTFFRRVSR